MIYRRGFEIKGPDVSGLEFYLIGEINKVLTFEAFGFGPGCVVLRSVEIHSRSAFCIAGELFFGVEDIFGNAAIDLLGFRLCYGWAGLPIIKATRDFTSFSGFNLIDFDGRE